MKKNRNARKQLNDLYLYLDTDYNNSLAFNSNIEKNNERYLEIREFYDKKFSQRHGNIYEWTEYYGLFKLKNGKIGIDPKRMNKKLRCFTNKQMEIMNKRKTVYFHPAKENYHDYLVNIFVSRIEELEKAFLKTYKPIIDKSLSEIKKMKEFTPGDCTLFLQGVCDHEEASVMATINNIKQEQKIYVKRIELYNSLYAQFFHIMASSIEAVTIKVWVKSRRPLKHFDRSYLYDIMCRGESARKLPSFKYHDRLYAIWNFIKHNNSNTYETLKETYPEILNECDYESGDLAIHYIKLEEKVILEILEGVANYFKEWCKLVLDEDYEEAQWNYSSYFLSLVSNEIELFTNPLGIYW